MANSHRGEIEAELETVGASYESPALRMRADDEASLATRPANGTLPNQNRNSIKVHQPGFQNWNLAAFKSFRFAEKQNVQFRFEAFNWVNHPNWGGPDSNPTSATFGLITGKGSERNLQLSLRYSF